MTLGMPSKKQAEKLKSRKMKEGWSMNEEWWRMNENDGGWMNNDEWWRLNDERWWFLAVVRFLFMTDKPMDGWMDICECRVTLRLKNLYHWDAC